MNEPRHILVVDEQRATLDFLRSVLPLVEGDRFEIQRVLSAEEGLLELRRRPYDLMMAGLRLPGMDGLEMARRARHLRPAMPIILASALPLPELREEAAAVGVRHFLSKPLDAEEFLTALESSLEDLPPLVLSSDLESLDQVETEDLPRSVIERLQKLCAEVGAGQVLLATVGGELLYAAGSQLHPDIPRLVAATAASVSCSLYVSEQLDEKEPQAVQFLEGERCDLYWANVGHDHFIAILFDAQIRRGRIGTVWVFARRAVADLQEQLSVMGDETPAEQSSAIVNVEDELATENNSIVEPQAIPDREPEKTETNLPQTEDAEVESDALSEASDLSSDIDLDDFWDEALASESGGDAFTNGISLEEAKKKGLVAEDFDPEDQ